MDWHKNWFFSGSLNGECFSCIPEDAEKFDFDSDCSADMEKIGKIAGKYGDECVIYHVFEMPTARTVNFSCCTENWISWYLNGQIVCNSGFSGNDRLIDIESHFLSFEIPQGKNLLAIHLQCHKNWRFGFKENDALLQNAEICINPDLIKGNIKMMNAVNNGPVKAAKTQSRGNMDLWKKINIPYVRNHDASFFSAYGGEHTVDIHAIFPDFSKDENDPESYFFSRTDRYLATILESGSKVFYRLGSKIEHQPEKFGTVVPPDFKKWASICEHIIRHYNQGWADGFHWNIEYWEIWNEPDLGCGGSSPTWQGTPEQYFDLYRTTATHLKKCFPELKIGGPALAYNLDWLRKFLGDMTLKNERVPLDFLSWHIYAKLPQAIKLKSIAIREMLDSFGYFETESILNEWNYLRDWESEFIYSVKSIISMKGAAFAASVMNVSQDSPTDMLMYYDARPCPFNGIFDFYTYAPLKTYYVFQMWSALAKLGSEVETVINNVPGFSAVAASDGKNNGIMICRYFEQDDLPENTKVILQCKNSAIENAKLFLLDSQNDMQEIDFEQTDGKIIFAMPANSVVYLQF